MDIEIESQLDDNKEDIVLNNNSAYISKRFILNKDTYKKLQIMVASQEFLNTRNLSSSITEMLEKIINQHYEDWKKKL